MAAKRITILAAFCLCAGCQAIDRRDSSDELHPLAEALPRQTQAEPGAPYAAPNRLQAEPEQRSQFVQPAAHIQPVQPPVSSEPIAPLPAFHADASGENMTLIELEEVALVSNPALAVAQARLDAARGKWVQVGLPPNTVLGYAGQQLGSHGLAEQQGVYVQQELVRGGKLRLNRAVVAREVEQAEQHLAAQQQRVLTDVRLGFYDVLIAQRRIEVTRQLSEIANQGVTTAEALFEAQEVSQVDVMRARIELQTASLLHQNAQNIYTAAWSRLNAVMGGSHLGPTPLIGELEAVVEDLDPDQAIQRLLAESPEMAIVLTEVERARWVIDRAYAEPVPNVDVQAVVQRDNGTGGNNGNLQVSIPIPWLDRNQGGIREAEASLVAAERAVGRLELDLQRRLATVFQQYATARNQFHAYSKQDGILSHSKTALDFVRGGYQAGESSYLDLLTAQRTYSQTNLAYIEALGELWAATVEIEGLLLKNSLTAAE